MDEDKDWKLKIDDLKNVKLNALPVYDDRYIKTKIKIYGDKVCINFCGLNVSEDYTESESSHIYFYWFFTCLWKQILLASIFDNCAYKITNKQMTDYLDENRFEELI